MEPIFLQVLKKKTFWGHFIDGSRISLKSPSKKALRIAPQQLQWILHQLMAICLWWNGYMPNALKDALERPWTGQREVAT
mmetsp:Transcript_23491/g.38028  ORF Transcript_23491/g.38028 Transcript_23491/m.38028 type:complete len:80 (-) Transcript_23491:233-472(-)